MDDYTNRGARALVLLHERALRDFVVAWKRAKAAGIETPQVEDPSYESMETLLRHVLRAARGYMTWTCETLDLPDPEIRATPEADAIADEVDAYVDHLCERWRLPLSGVDERTVDRTEAKSRWGVVYCADAMLEHAVMHPLRHAFQIEEWLGGKSR